MTSFVCRGLRGTQGFEIEDKGGQECADDDNDNDHEDDEMKGSKDCRIGGHVDGQWQKKRRRRNRRERW